MAGADYLHGRNGDFVVKEPMALGHEAAGEIVAVGKGVQGFAVGDRVAIEAGQYCSSCRKSLSSEIFAADNIAHHPV